MVSSDSKPASWRPGHRKAPVQRWPEMRGADVTRYGVEPLLSLQQAAAILGVKDDAVRARVLDGRLPALKLAGRWKVRRSDLPVTGPEQPG